MLFTKRLVKIAIHHKPFEPDRKCVIIREPPSVSSWREEVGEVPGAERGQTPPAVPHLTLHADPTLQSFDLQSNSRPFCFITAG